MTLPISSLANMDFMLYGGLSGADPNCPSYINGYKAGNPYMTYCSPQYLQNILNSQQYADYRNNFNPSGSVTQTIPQVQQTQQSQTTAQSAATKADINTLTKFYEDSNSMVQKWGDIGTSALFIAAAENSQVLKHPFNSIRAIKTTNMIFDKSNTAIQALWQKNPQLMQRAYGQLHAVNRMAQPKFSFVQKWFQKPITETARKDLEKIMADAIKSGDEKAILRATETLKASRGMDGYIPTAWNKVKNFFGGNAKNLTPQERILWKLLRNHSFYGYEFRRQYVMGEYIVDFICRKKKIIIEVDGGQHNTPDEILYDNKRSAFFNSLGYRVLRFWNSDIDKNIEGVYKTLLKEFEIIKDDK